jgi:hypothetical protein
MSALGQRTSAFSQLGIMIKKSTEYTTVLLLVQSTMYSTGIWLFRETFPTILE